MSTPKRLKFSDCGDGGDSDTSLQKHAVAEEEDPVKKKKTTKKKKKRLGSPVNKRIWNEEEELTILKGLVDYRVKTRLDANFDWDGFFDFVRGSVHVSFSKEQLFSKIRNLRRKFDDNMERINQGKDPLFTRSTDSQAFGYSKMIWGQNEDEAEAADETSIDNVQVANGRSMEKAEVANGSMEKAEVANGTSMENAEAANGTMEQAEAANGTSMEHAEAANGTSMEHAEVANGTSMEKAEAANGTSMEHAEVANGTSMENAEVASERSMEKAKFVNGSVEKEIQIENDEDSFEENEQVGNDEHVNGNGAKKKRKVDGKSMHGAGVQKTTEYMTDGKEIHQVDDDDDDLCVVQDALETMVLQGLSGYQKKLQLEKVRNLGTGKRKELSNEWKALCAEEVELNIKKLRFSVKLVEAANGVVV